MSGEEKKELPKGAGRQLDSFDQYLQRASNVAEGMDHVPEFIFGHKSLAALLLVEGTEGGLVVSGTYGEGVLIARKDGKWSNPVAVTIDAWGFGAVLGGAKKEIVIAFNKGAYDKFVEGSYSVKFGGNIGLTVGNSGRDVGGMGETMEAEGSEWARSMIYTKSKGALISAEFQSGTVTIDKKKNLEYYGTKDVEEIFDAKLPEGSKVPDLLAKIEKASKPKE